MSVYRPAQSKYWHYDFQHKGRRYHGSTGCTSRRDAERFEAKQRREAALGFEAKPLITLNDLVQGWYLAIGQHGKSKATTFYQARALADGLGRNKALSDLTVLDLDGYIARRRATRKNASVNREIQLLRRMARWAADRGFEALNINWRAVLLPEPPPTHRELSVEEQQRLFEHLPESLKPIVQFALLTGLRKAEIVNLCWADVDLAVGKATVRAKGGRPHTIALTTAAVALIANQPKCAAQVFTYLCERHSPARADRPRRIPGQRYPFSAQGWNRKWREALAAAGIADYRFHDNRHTVATRALRASGNLRVVQRLLGHSDIRTTTRYAHALDSDVRDALEAAEASAAAASPGIVPEQKRKA